MPKVVPERSRDPRAIATPGSKPGQNNAGPTMYYGIQLSSSGVLTSLYRTDVAANNLANVGTVGFKPDMAFTRQRDAVRIEDGVGSLPSNRLIEKLGAGVHLAPNIVNYGQGNIETTDNDLDLAIKGDGFFVLRDSADRGASGLLYTRDGRFTRNAQGQLVQAATGLPVMNAAGSAVQLRPGGRVQISAEGQVRQDGELVATLRLEDVADRRQLKKVGANAFRPSTAALANRAPFTGDVVQGAIEKANVSEIDAMLLLQRATGSVGSNITMIQYQDRMMDRAINTFSRVG